MNLKQLLKKQKWTGKEAGIMEITSMAQEFKERLEGNPSPIPLVSPDKMYDMISNFTTEDADIYNGYISIHQWLNITYNIALTHEQQAQFQINNLSSFIHDAGLTEDIYLYRGAIPVTMTEKEYTAEKTRRRDAWHTENGEPKTDGAAAILYRTLCRFLALREDHPRKKNPLKEILDAYKLQEVQSRFILSRYNDAAYCGYVILDNGRRSDQLTRAEIKNILRGSPAGAWEADRRGLYGESLENEEYKALRLQDVRARIWKDHASGKDRELEQKLISDNDFELGLLHIKETAPEGLSKWDILEDPTTLQRIYKNIFTPGVKNNKDYTQEAQDFTAEFPELTAALISLVDQKGPVKIKDIPLDQWADTRFSWDALYSAGMYGYKEAGDNDRLLWADNWRATKNGISILTPTSPHGTEAAYTEPRPQAERPFLSSARNLFCLFPDASTYADAARNIRQNRGALLDSLYFLNGYNRALDVIAAFYGIPGIKVFKRNLDPLRLGLRAFNLNTSVLSMKIACSYDDKDLQRKKNKVLNTFFKDIDLDKITTPDYKFFALERMFPDFSAFENSNLIDLVCYNRPKDRSESEAG